MFVLKSRHRCDADQETTADILCDRYLTQVFRYMNCCINDSGPAGELTLKSLKQALVEYGHCYRNEKKFSRGIFTCARKEVLDYSKKSAVKPLLPGLSAQEQEVLSLRLGAELNNRMISELLGLSESRVGMIISGALVKLSGSMEVPV